MNYWKRTLDTCIAALRFQLLTDQELTGEERGNLDACIQHLEYMISTKSPDLISIINTQIYSAMTKGL